MSKLVHGRKFCTKCRTLKLLSKFYLDKEGRFGVSSWCKECGRKKNKKYYEANPEKVKERNRKYREANIEKIKESRRKYREANPEKVKERGRKYREANPEKVKERSRKWHEANPFKTAIRMVKNRAEKKKIPFDLDIEHLEQLWEICGGICPMTGVPMLKRSEKGRDPFVMSMDRIISEKGYTKGNIRLVSLWYNIARSNNDDKFTLEMFQRTIDHAHTIA